MACEAAQEAGARGLGLASPVPAVPVAAVTIQRVTLIGQRLCTCCSRKVPLLSFRFMDRDVEVAACSRCDDLTPKAWVPKEKP